MMIRTRDEQEVLDLARQTAERLQALTVKLEAYINAPATVPDTGQRRRSDDKDKP